MSDETAVATVTIQTPAGPVTATAAQSPQQRFAALAKAYGAPEQKTAVTTVPAGMHWDPTTKGFVDTLDKTPPKAPPAPSDIKAFDAEMRAKGLQFDPNTPSVPADQIDTKALAKLNAIYAAMTPEEREARRADYHKDLQTIYAGRRGDELMKDFEARKLGQPAAVAPVSKYTPAEWEKGHASVTDKDGFIPADRINKDGLSGYTLPRFLPTQTYRADIFDLLATARAANYTQSQVDAFIRAGMAKQGLLK